MENYIKSRYRIEKESKRRDLYALWSLLSISVLVFAVVGLVLISYKIAGKIKAAITPECSNGMEVSYTGESKLRCVDGTWKIQGKTEIEMAQEAKKEKADYEARLLERYKFCGEGNVDTQLGYGYEKRLPCKDYSLVPDENLNI